jgi:hypothetical protein
LLLALLLRSNQISRVWIFHIASSTPGIQLRISAPSCPDSPDWRSSRLTFQKFCHSFDYLTVTSHNRLQPLGKKENASKAFSNLEELAISGTSITWPEAIELLEFMPRLMYLELGVNGLKSLDRNITRMPLKSFRELNMDGNQLHDWANILAALSSFPW